jgi:hypothetical protein
MAEDYKVFVHMDVLGILPKSGARRKSVLEFLASLGSFAHLGGDYQEKDPENGRPVEVSLVAGYALTWWVDAPVREVKLVQIRPAD